LHQKTFIIALSNIDEASFEYISSICLTLIHSFLPTNAIGTIYIIRAITGGIDLHLASLLGEDGDQFKHLAIRFDNKFITQDKPCK
jgi:hypothetical protein